MAQVVNLIAEYTVAGGTITSGQTYAVTPTTSNGGGLGSNEVYDVRWMEVYDTVTGTTPDNVGAVVPVVDGTAIPQYLSVLGRYDGLMAPPLDLLLDPENADLWGVSIMDALESGPDSVAFLATGLKAATSIGAQITATGGTIANAIKIRFYGERYQVDKLAGQAGPLWTVPQIITDPQRGISLVLPAKPLGITKAGWNKLPGGVLQDAPMVNKFQRYAFNKNGTTVNIPYSFDENSGNVLAGVNQNLTLDAQNNPSAWLLQRLGVRDSSGNILKAYVNIPGVTPYPNIPYSGIPAGQYTGTTWTGWAYPRLPQNNPQFYPMPQIPGGPLLVANEIAHIQALDNGTTAGANTVIAAVSGLQIDKIPASTLASIPNA